MLDPILIYSPIWIPVVIILGLILWFVVPHLLAQYALIFGNSSVLLFKLSVIWFPLFLGITFAKLWMKYARAYFLHKMDWVLLEIRLPQEVLKSPLAMETFLTFLHQTGGETTFIDTIINGSVRAHFSLEIVSIEGQVKFFIYTQKKFKNLIETGLYAQYPNVEIHEAPDYAKSVNFDPKEMDLYVIDYKLSQPDPYPIKTYMDYGIDREMVEEENKIDPINTIIEFLGSIGANQQCWLQIIIRAHKKDYKKGLFGDKVDKWKEDAKSEIEKIRKSTIPKEGDLKFPNPTKGEIERIAAIERSVSKMAFDTGIRSIYMGKKEFFNGTNIGGQRAILRAYTAPHLNSFSPTNWLNGYDYPWQDFRKIRQNGEKRDGLDAYKRRSFFYPPHIGHRFVLNVEELASIFHLPGQVTRTPTLTRIPSKKSQAPSNLPI